MADGSSSGWAGQPSIRLADIDSAKLALTAIEKCLRWKNPQRLEPGNYTVVLEPTAAGDLVRLMVRLVLRAQHRGRPHISQQARRRNSARRKSVPGIHHSAHRSFRSSPAALPLDRRSAAHPRDYVDRQRRGRESRLRSLLGRKNRQASRHHRRRRCRGFGGGGFGGWRQPVWKAETRRSTN